MVVLFYKYIFRVIILVVIEMENKEIQLFIEELYTRVSNFRRLL